MRRLLLIEPDTQLAMVLQHYFIEHQFSVALAKNSQVAIETLNQNDFDLVIMELDLPDANGYQLLRQQNVLLKQPMLVTTSQTDAATRIGVLQLGARDVLQKPFDLQELLLRSNNIITYREPQKRKKTNRIGAYVLDDDNKSLVSQDSVITLTVNEYRLLASLVRKPGKVYSRSELVDSIAEWGGPESQRAVDITVSRLRKKLEQNPKQPQILITVTGFGYKLQT